MPGDDAQTAVDQDRNVEAKSRDAARQLPDLLGAVTARIDRIWSTDPVSALQIFEEFGCRLDAGYQQVIPGAGAGDVEQVALAVVDLFEVGILGDIFRCAVATG